jgi:prevent-host-death family protein
MAEYSVAEAKNSLPALIEKAEAGEHVVITRHGHPVVELRPVAAVKPRSVSSYAWLKQSLTEAEAGRPQAHWHDLR